MIYAHMENARKDVHMEKTHNCGDSCTQNFSISGEYAKRTYAYTENAHTESKHTWRMREKNLCMCM